MQRNAIQPTTATRTWMLSMAHSGPASEYRAGRPAVSTVDIARPVHRWDRGVTRHPEVERIPERLRSGTARERGDRDAGVYRLPKKGAGGSPHGFELQFLLTRDGEVVVPTSDVAGTLHVGDGSTGVVTEAVGIFRVATETDYTARPTADDDVALEFAERGGQRHASSPPRTAPVNTTYRSPMHPTVTYLMSWLMRCLHEPRVRLLRCAAARLRYNYSFL